MKNLLLAVMLLPLFSVSCKNGEADNPDLTNYEWQLEIVYGKTVPDTVKATLFLAPFEPICNGSSGCNSYGADYVWAGDKLQFKNLVSTEKACLGIMDWESDFYEALQETAAYQIENGKLELKRNGEVIAVLK